MVNSQSRIWFEILVTLCSLPAWTTGKRTIKSEALASSSNTKSPSKRTKSVVEQEEEGEGLEDENEEPVRKRSRRGRPAQEPALPKTRPAKGSDRTSLGTMHKTSSKAFPVKGKLNGNGGEAEPSSEAAEEANTNVLEKSEKAVQTAENEANSDRDVAEDEDEESEEEKLEIAAKAREKVQSTLKSQGKDPYPDWKPGEPVPYAALCSTFSLIEMTTKRLIISAHCSLFLRQVLRLTPQDLLPTIQLMINKLAADYAGIELGIGESLIMKAIGESTGRSLAVVKADQNEIGDLGLVAAKSRSIQPTMFKPKALTVRGVLEGLMAIAVSQGSGSQQRKVDGIKKLLSSADAALAGKMGRGIDITKDKGGASEAKFLIRFLEGKLRLGLAEKTVLVALAHAMVIHELEKRGNKVPSSEQLAKGEAILKQVYRYDSCCYCPSTFLTSVQRAA